MPRLFTGLDVPRPVAMALSQWRGGLSGARWIDPDQYHVTLRFFGDVDLACARMLDDMLAQAFHPVFTLKIAGLRIFGGDRPRALVAEIAPDTELLHLQAEQERMARRAGLEAQTRKFTPHVTLARLRDVSPYQAAAFLSGAGVLPPLSFPVERCVLYSSRSGVGGGPYVMEAVYPFGADMDDEEEDWAYADRA